MKLKARISPQALDEILSGRKVWEYRGIETITLTDGKRKKTFFISDVERVPDTISEHLFEVMPSWFPGNTIIRMRLVVEE